MPPPTTRHAATRGLGPDLAFARALRAAPELSRRDARRLVAAVAAAHLAALWALMQVPAVRAVMHDVAPMMIDLVAPPQPPPAQPVARPTPRAAAQPTPRPRPAPVPPMAAVVAETPAAATFTAPAPAPEPLPTPAPAPAIVAAPPAPPAPSPAPLRRAVSATAVQYLAMPPVEVPLASRRAGESGIVWLRVVVDVRGLPVQIQLQRSSGHPRLDAQALWAMRQARFKPQTENGTPIELEVTAPIDYPLD